MYNSITIHGRLTHDSELKQTQSGVSVCRLTVAVDRSYKSGEEKQTDFFTVICWRGLADMAAKYFRKGKEILVSGEMQSRKWQDSDGNNRTAWEIQAKTIDFCGSKSTEAPQPLPEGIALLELSRSDMEELKNDDDLPF